MNIPQLRRLIREADLRPVRVSLDDGRSFTLVHPDYGLVTEDGLIIANGPGMDLKGSSFVICYFDHITSVEVVKKRSRSKAA